MRFATRTLAAVLALTATVAIAAEGVQDPLVKARQDLMQTVVRHTMTLGDMASGKTAFDATAAAAAREGLIAAAAEIPAKFETQADDPKSEAVVDKLWANFADFTAKGEAMGAAATALDASSLASVQAGMGAIGGSCRDCHQAYRAKR